MRDYLTRLLVMLMYVWHTAHRTYTDINWDKHAERTTSNWSSVLSSVSPALWGTCWQTGFVITYILWAYCLNFVLSASSNFPDPGCLPTTNDWEFNSIPPTPALHASHTLTFRKNCNDFLFCLTQAKLETVSSSQPLHKGSTAVSSSWFVCLLLHKR